MQNVPFAAIRLTCYFLDGIYVVPFHKLDDAEQRKPRGVRNPDKRHSVKTRDGEDDSQNHERPDFVCCSQYNRRYADDEQNTHDNGRRQDFCLSLF